MMKPLIPVGRDNSPTRTDANPFAMLQQEMDRLFDGFSRSFTGLTSRALMPSMDLAETENEIELTAEQWRKRRAVERGGLTILGEKKDQQEEKGKDYHLVERSYGSFVRTVDLPQGVNIDSIKAVISKGVLKVTVPKPAKRSKSKRQLDLESRTRVARTCARPRSLSPDAANLGEILYQFPEQTVDRYMTRKVKTVSCDVTMCELNDQFASDDFNAYPVVDDQMEAVGLVTKFDFLKCFAFTLSSMVPHYDELMKRTVSDVDDSQIHLCERNDEIGAYVAVNGRASAPQHSRYGDGTASGRNNFARGCRAVPCETAHVESSVPCNV